MSTVYANTRNSDTTNNRFFMLARTGESLFHSNDLANLWCITDANTLHTTLKRYVDRGYLTRLYKGFYALGLPNDIDPFVLGLKALHSYGYVSTESVLVREGVMAQSLAATTLIAAEPKRFTVLGERFVVRQLAPLHLYNPVGVREEKKGVRVATVARAVADLLYYVPTAYFDAPSLVPWDEVRSIECELGYRRCAT